MNSGDHQITGIISGIIAAIGFIVYHYFFMSPIWGTLPFAALFGALTGYGLGLSYERFFDRVSIFNSIKLFLIYLLPLVILTLGILLFVDPIYTLDEVEAIDTGTLLGITFSIVIVYGLIYGVIQGLVMGKDKLYPSVFTNFFILTGIGHNIPVFNLIDLGEEYSIVKIQMKVYVVITVMMTIFVISFHLLSNMKIKSANP